MNKPLLIIGRPHSSKTVFITQFYSRLQKNKSKLFLYEPVADLSAITASREALAKGDEPEPTNTEKNTNLILPIQCGEQKINLHCPDYGGEQINGILTRREIDKKWIQAIKESDNWIYFVRLTSVIKTLDVSNSTVSKENPVNKKESDPEPYSISDQSALIELLQIILHSKEYNYHVKNSKVKLTVVLTCWDELGTIEKTPKEILKEHLPLLLNFIESNWDNGKFKVIGLSALGFSLTTPENKERYEIDGPENYGYLVFENGEETNDITELIIEAL